jgi:hypothetical protein
MKYWIAFSLLLSAVSSSYATFISASPAEALYTREQNPLDEDACPPQTIVSTPLTINGNTTNSQHNYELSCVSTGGAPDDIYGLSLFCRGTVTVSLCGSNYDTALEVHYGTNYFDCPGSQILACNDDFCGLQSQVSFNIEAGEFYFIIVSGYFGNSGAYTMNVTANLLPPLNDNCAGAFPITSLPYQDFGSTACANNSTNPPCAFSNAPDVWYALQLPCGAYVTATTCGHPLMDAVLHVYTVVNPCDDYPPLVCNDDACANFQSSVSFAANANQLYYIVVDGYNTSSGYYVLNVSAEHLCPTGIFVAIPGTTSGDTRCANNDYPQCGLGDANENVFTFSIQQCMRVTASLCGSSYDPIMEIRSGTNCPGDNVIACMDDGYCDGEWTLTPTIIFDADPSQTYWVIVGGYYGSAGPYVLSLDAVPCPVVPPISDLVVQPDAPNGNMLLFWSAIPGADYYQIFASPTSDNFPPNPIDVSYGPSYTHVNALNDYDRLFYSVIAVDLPNNPPAPPTAANKPVPPVSPQVSVQVPPWITYDYSMSQQK